MPSIIINTNCKLWSVVDPSCVALCEVWKEFGTFRYNEGRKRPSAGLTCGLGLLTPNHHWDRSNQASATQVFHEWQFLPESLGSAQCDPSSYVVQNGLDCRNYRRERGPNPVPMLQLSLACHR